MASEGGIRMRLNVNALVNEETVGKFLVVVGEEAGMDQLVGKIQHSLRRSGIASSIEKVCNNLRAVLPHDEFLGDMLRDGEEIFVVLRGQDGQLMESQGPVAASYGAAPAPMQQPMQQMGTTVPCVANVGACHGGIMPMSVQLIAPQLGADEDESDDEEVLGGAQDATPAAYPPPPHTLQGVMGGAQQIPGPSENFEMLNMPFDLVQVDHPCEPIAPTTYDNDWLVEGLTPNLRDFVLEHFQAEFITEPKYVSSIGKFVGPRFYQACGSFVSIFMRPQTAIGSDPSNTMPVHYNITKHDLNTFQRKAEAHIDKAQQHLDLFSATFRGLQALLQKGMAETDHISEMLPHSYQAMEEVEGAMMEVDSPIFPKIDGSNPIIIVDTSGFVGEHLMFVKAALKRALYAHMGGKTSFQLIRFQAAGGEPRLWMQGMVPPTEDALCSAEAWIENLVPITNARLVNGLRYAVTHQDCDAIHVVSSADVPSSHHEALIASIRHINTREIPINTIGIDPNHLGELLMRNIAESNHGDFTLKSFSGQPHGAPAYCNDDTRWTSWRTHLVNEKSKQLCDNFKKPKMSIGSQIRIIEVMQREEKQKEDSWREEWKCTQRLLLSADTTKKGNINGDRDMVKELERKTGRTQLARVGGGYMYATQPMDLGLEHLFEHQSAVPWTANTDTAATGPKVPCGGAGLARQAKFPPTRDLLPEAVLPMPERRTRPRSAGLSSSTQQGLRRSAGPLSASGNPWDAASPMNKTRAKRAPGNGGRAPSPGRRAPSPSGGPRAASADRAAGGGNRQASPSAKGRGRPSPRAMASKGNSHTFAGDRAASPVHLPPLASTAGPPPQPMLPQPRLERRWSF